MEENAPLDESLNTSVANDSYYSLESDNESPNISDFVQEPSLTQSAKKSMIVESMSEEENTEAGHNLKLLENMSDESTTTTGHHRLTVESMSEEDTFAQPLRTHVEVQTQIEVHAEPPCLPPETVVRSESLPPDTVVEPPHLFPETTNTLLISNVRSTPLENTLSESSGSLLRHDDMASTFIVTDAPTLLAPLEPVLIGSNTPMESLPTSELLHPSDEWSHYESQPEVDHSSVFQFNPTAELESADSFREEFSLDTYEKETILESNATCTQIAEPSSENSVIEIREDSAKEESDSDIEIVEDSSTPLSGKVVRDEHMDDAATEENDDMSERTYESDYSYSHESAEAEGSYADEELVSEEEIADDAGDVEEELEEDADEYDEEEDDECEEEEEYSADEADESTAEKKEPAVDEYDQELLQQNNLDVNYDELKKIMSSVTEAKAEAETKNETVLSEQCDSYKMPIITSFSDSENASVCEVFEMTPSVIEETVTIGNLDVTRTEAENDRPEQMETDERSEKPVYSLDTDDESEGEKQSSPVGVKSQDTSVEVLSLSRVESSEKTASDEPPMVFYFGENSVASIGDELLCDELPESASVKPEDSAKPVARSAESEPADDEHSRNSSNKNATVEKDEGYEEPESCLTATQPECDVHRIEKIDNETNRFAADLSLASGDGQPKKDDTVYVQLEAEEVCDYESTKSDSQPPMETNNESAVGTGEQPEDLTQHDLIARERTYDQAKEANRLADAGKEKSDKKMSGDGLALLGEEVVSSTYPSVPGN